MCSPAYSQTNHAENITSLAKIVQRPLLARRTSVASHIAHYRYYCFSEVRPDLFSAPRVGVGRIGSAAKANLNHAFTVEQSLLHTAPERCAVSDLLPQGNIACVSMSIHVDQTHRTVSDTNNIGSKIRFKLPFSSPDDK